VCYRQVNSAPVAIALGPCDAAKIRREIDRLVELRLDHHPPGGVDQSPFAAFEKGQKTEIEADADPLGADVDPRLTAPRPAR
jgi:hypothetical protein